MSWEIVAGFVTLLGAFVSVMTVVVKVNSTLTRLDEAVRQLHESLGEQKKQSESLKRTLASHETRLSVLEDEWRRQ